MMRKPAAIEAMSKVKNPIAIQRPKFYAAAISPAYT